MKIYKLSSLVMNDTITDDDTIEIYDTLGNFVTRGNWYQDQILDFGGFFGSVTFRQEHVIRFALR